MGGLNGYDESSLVHNTTLQQTYLPLHFSFPTSGHPFFRLVLEKPFGNDLKSAQELADSLAKDFTDHEIYRIDHYLGKTVVKYILPFR